MDGNVFEVRTTIGFIVRLSKERWNLIVTAKHPVMLGREADVRLVLSSPEQIRRSRSDTSVFLFYRAERPRRWICVVVKRVDNASAFVITVYPTDTIKEGETVWIR